MTRICYSLDDEEFRYDSLGDVIDAMDEPQVGSVYYEADCRELAAPDFADNNTIEHLLEHMDEDLFEEVGEIADCDFTSVPPEAKEELRALVQAWVEKHVNVTRYWRIVGKSRECRLTAEDLTAGGAA